MKKGMARKAKTDPPIASDSFLKAVERAARTFRDFQEKGIDESSIQAIEAVKQKQEEHEERKRRISEKISNGARLSRNL
jgi:hypothetical protein